MASKACSKLSTVRIPTLESSMLLVAGNAPNLSPAMSPYKQDSKSDACKDGRYCWRMPFADLATPNKPCKKKCSETHELRIVQLYVCLIFVLSNCKISKAHLVLPSHD